MINYKDRIFDLTHFKFKDCILYYETKQSENTRGTKSSLLLTFSEVGHVENFSAPLVYYQY